MSPKPPRWKSVIKHRLSLKELEWEYDHAGQILQTVSAEFEFYGLSLANFPDAVWEIWIRQTRLGNSRTADARIMWLLTILN